MTEKKSSEEPVSSMKKKLKIAGRVQAFYCVVNAVTLNSAEKRKSEASAMIPEHAMRTDFNRTVDMNNNCR